jgi:hypothetical protein
MSKLKVQKKITDFFKSVKSVKNKSIIRGYNSETDDWHCLICGISMGPTNPRQLCGKTWCFNI